MAKYRKKPVEIEACRFITNNEPGYVNMNNLVEWINADNNDGRVAHHDGTDIYIDTLEGTMRAEVGDYIIKGVQGEFYPCKPDIFAATYEFVMDDEEMLQGQGLAESFTCSSCGELVREDAE